MSNLKHGRSLRSMFIRPACTLAIGILMVACGRSSEGATVASMNVEQVLDAYLTALRANDREQALALTTDDEQAIRADEALHMVQSYMFSTATSGPYATGGKLSEVRIVTLEDRGNVTYAWSRWQYQQKAVCHETILTQTPQGWRVSEFFVAGDSGKCAR